MAGVDVGAGVKVWEGSTIGKVSATKGCAGASVAAGASAAAGACVAAAPPQAVSTKDRLRIKRIRRNIWTHFRIHAGQQVDSVSRGLISPDNMFAMDTVILPFMTTLKAKVFPSGDQSGVSTRPL